MRCPYHTSHLSLARNGGGGGGGGGDATPPPMCAVAVARGAECVGGSSKAVPKDPLPSVVNVSRWIQFCSVPGVYAGRDNLFRANDLCMTFMPVLSTAVSTHDDLACYRIREDQPLLLVPGLTKCRWGGSVRTTIVRKGLM